MKPIAGKGQYPYNIDGFCISGAKINGVTHVGGFNIHQQRSDCVFDLIDRSNNEIIQFVQLIAHDKFAQPLRISVPTATLVDTIPDNTFFVKTVRTDGGQDSFLTSLHLNIIKLLSGERLAKPWPLIACDSGDLVEDYSFHITPAVHGWIGDELHISVLSNLTHTHIPGTFTYDGHKVSVLELLEHALKLRRENGGYHTIKFKPHDGRSELTLDVTNYVDKADKLVAVMIEGEASHEFQVYGSRHLKKDVPFYVQLVSEPEWFAPREPLLPDSYVDTIGYDGYPVLSRNTYDNKLYEFTIPRLSVDNLMDSGTISYSELTNHLVDPNIEPDYSKCIVNGGNYGIMLHSAGDNYIRFPDYAIEVINDIGANYNSSELSGPVRLGETLYLRPIVVLDNEGYAPTSPSRSLWRWKSSDPSVASITNEGIVTTHKEGTTKLDFYFEGYPALTFKPNMIPESTQYLTVKADVPLTVQWSPSSGEVPVSADESGGTKISVVTVPNNQPIALPNPRINYSTVGHYNKDTSTVWFTAESSGNTEYRAEFNMNTEFGLFPSQASLYKSYYAKYKSNSGPIQNQIYFTLPYTVTTFGTGIDVIPVGSDFSLTLDDYPDLSYEIIDPDNILTIYEAPYYESNSWSKKIMFRTNRAGKIQLRIDYPDHDKYFLFSITVLPVPTMY